MPYLVAVDGLDEIEVHLLRNPAMNHQHPPVDHRCQRQPAEDVLEEYHQPGGGFLETRNAGYKTPEGRPCLRQNGHSQRLAASGTQSPSLAGAATSIIFVATKVLRHVCRDKTRLLSREKYACRDKILCLSRHIIVATNILLSRQKTCFVVSNT